MPIKLLQSCLTLWDLMDCSLPVSSVQGFSRQEYHSSPEDLPDPRIRPACPPSPALAMVGRFFTTSANWAL